MTSKRWNQLVLGLTVSILLIIALFQIMIDPFLHYHDKLVSLEYPLLDERYVNDGLQRHKQYEILITGTSISQNFNASIVERLWGKKALKTAYSGATSHELSQAMENALGYNHDIEMIICSLDPSLASGDPYEDTYLGIPYYLYDNNYFNDAEYLFNKEILSKSVAVLNYTKSGQKTPNSDLYGRFDVYMPSGVSAVMANYSRPDVQDFSVEFSEMDKKKLYDNIMHNYVELAEKHPDTQFVFFLPPYSYCFWDSVIRTNQMKYNINMLKYVVSLLMDTDNISVYSFYENDDVTANLDHYTDIIHFNGTVCDMIAESIYSGEGRLTKDNYENYFNEIEELYTTMDYSLLDK